MHPKAPDKKTMAIMSSVLVSNKKIDNTDIKDDNRDNLVSG
jgi:hypothetical protein